MSILREMLHDIVDYFVSPNVPVAAPRRTCTGCHGATMVACAGCDGTGGNCARCRGKGVVTCPRCWGVGTIAERV
jgi:hypothetical protein